MSESKVERLLLEQPGSGQASAELPRAGVLVIGSDARRAGFVVAGVDVADVHCAIGRTKGGGFAIKDLGSAAGTILNGKSVESARLMAGDEIQLGTARLVVVDPERPNARRARGPRPDETQSIDTANLAPEIAAALARTSPAASTVASPFTNSGPKEPEVVVRTALPTITGYRIERVLGRGGMGQVFLAVQTSLERKVALKVLATKFEADREFVRRFQAEARAAAALSHPNVVTVYDVGEDKGTHYLSMEFMEKGNLEDRVGTPGATGKAARLPESEVLDILRDAALGLAYAEARGIVHRDLKPANLMQSHVGQTKIADLGLATHVEAEEAQTADKKVFGTPHFMSPEQARGERVDHRSDLYSLGATAYRLLTGHTPFEGTNARDIVRSLLRDEPRSMKELAPDLSDGIVGFVARLMKKDVAQRFQSANDVLREIDRLRSSPAAGEAAAKSNASPGRELPHAESAIGRASGGSRNRSHGGLLTFVALLAVAGGGWFLWKQFKQAKDADAIPLLGGKTPLVAPTDTAAPADPEAGTPDSVSAATVPDKPKSGPKEKDDKEIQLFEANARVALLELIGRTMSKEQMRDELRALAGRFEGTNAANEAREKADGITTELTSAETAASTHKSAIEGVISRMRTAAKLDELPPHPGTSFLAMRAVDGQQGLAQDPDFVTERKKLETAVSETAVVYARQVLLDTQRDLDRGDFESVQKTLTALMPVFELPDFPMGQSPADIAALHEIGRTARERLANLNAMQGQFETHREREDARTIALAFGGQGGLEHELKTLDLSAAKARLEALSKKLSSTTSQTSMREFAEDCARGQAILETLGREFDAGGWRLKRFTDPRDKKNVTRNAVGANASGIAYEADGGAVETVPWSAFGGNTKELARLFFERCTREWKPEELASIAALLRVTACVEAAELSGKMLDPTKHAHFTEANARDLLEAFNTAQTWAQRAGNAPGAGADKLARELEAAQILVAALRQTSDEQWSTAVASVERLLHDEAGTLIVRLLSNGKPPEAVKSEASTGDAAVGTDKPRTGDPPTPR